MLERGDGGAVFSTLEDILHIEVRLNGAGQAQVGRLRTLRDLDATLRSFPVRRKAEQQ